MFLKLFFSKYLVEWKIVCTFALAFEKSSIPQGNKRKLVQVEYNEIYFDC